MVPTWFIWTLIQFLFGSLVVDLKKYKTNDFNDGPNQPMINRQPTEVDMDLQEIKSHFETANPDENYTISVEAMRRVLYNYARTFNIELRIQEHLPAKQRVHFDDFYDYFLSNTTETPFYAYHANGHLRWTANLPTTSIETTTTSTIGIIPPETLEEVSEDQVIILLQELNTGEISFAEFLSSHDPNEDDLRTLDIRI